MCPFLLPVLFLFIALPTHADDFSVDRNAFVYTNAIICESYTNLDPSQIYIYGYSPTIGQARGMGWATIQEGKCYQYDPNGDLIQDHKFPLPLTEKQQQELSLASKYPAGPVSQYTPDLDWNDQVDGNFEYEVGGYGGNNANILLNITDILSFTKPMESTFKGKGVLDDPVLSDPKMVQAQGIVHSLAAQLSMQVQSCDTRVRIEQRFNESDHSPFQTIWRLKDGSDQLITASTTLSQELSYMGCDPSLVDNFKKDHSSQLATLDTINTYLQNLYGDPFNGTATKLSQQYDVKAGYGSDDVQGSARKNVTGTSGSSHQGSTSTPLARTENDGAPIRIFPEQWLGYIYLYALPVVGIIGLGTLWCLRRRK
jgi:hypothetical protein